MKTNYIAKGTKAHILQILKKAEQKSLTEQDQYREVIDRSIGPEGSKDIHKQYLKGGWKQITKAMDDCTFPPKPGDRKQYLKVDWNEEINRIRLQKIKDEDIRCTTHFANEFFEHTQRLRSMALFVERIGTLQGRGGMLHFLWSKNSSLYIMKEEAVLMGKDEEAKMIQQICNANDAFAQLLFKIEWDEESIRNLLNAAIAKK